MHSNVKVTFEVSLSFEKKNDANYANNTYT